MSKTGVPSSAFESQTTITSVFFGSNCATIGENAFKNCISLSEINTDNNIENIGSNAFAGTNISIAKFPVLSTLHKGAFSNCSNLSHINIPCNSIPENAFKDCISLSVTDIEPVTNIGSSAFESCTALTSINIPNCSIIENNAFKNCTNLSNVSNGIVKICSNAFSSCTQLRNMNFNKLTEIENNAFRDCDSLTIANIINCEKIGANAFYDCGNLKQVTLSKCKEIGLKAFSFCNKLEKVYINNTVDTFCELKNINAFCGCSDVSSECSTKTKFLFRVDTIASYKTATNWSHFSKNMLIMAQPNHIIYTTNNNSKITIPSTIPSDTYTHTYESSTNYGLIEFNSKIESLNQQIFKGSTTVTSVDMPSECLSIANNEFEGCTSLNDINLSDTLETIGEYAFKNCTSLTSFNLPYSLNTIGEGAFAGSNIEKFEGNINFIEYNEKAVVSNNVLIYVSPIHDSTKPQVCDTEDISIFITRLGKSCFYGCEDIKRVNIYSGVREIGDKAFEGCKNLCEVHFSGNTPPTLGENVFGDAKSDLKIFVPENKLQEYYDIFSQKGYGDKVFPEADNYSIIYYSSRQLNSSHKQTNLSFANGQYYKISSHTSETLSANIFTSQASVTRVILSDTIKRIGENAFYGCTGLNYIYLSDSITELNNKCFYGCKSLEKMHIPYGINISALSSQKSILGTEIFRGCEKLTELRSYYKGYISDDNMCYIQSIYPNPYYPYVYLMLFAHGCKEKYTVPEYINSINFTAFKGSTIKEISLPSQIYNIGTSAFEDCSNLQSINWNNVQSISKLAFANCNNLGGISIPNNLTSIGEGAFQECKNMVITQNIPDSVTSIGKSAFKNCSNFKYVNGTDTESQLNLGKITAINESTFEGCTSLSQINITNNITKINKNAFKGCTKLVNLNLTENLKEIGESAFENCTYFQGNSEISGSGTFPIKNTTHQLSLPKSVTSIGNSCFKNTGIRYVTISSGIEKIPDRAFSDCASLCFAVMTGADNLKEIGYQSFYNCASLCKYQNNTLTLRNTITKIGDEAFYRCPCIYVATLPLNILSLGDLCLPVMAISINEGSVKPAPTFYKNGNLDTSSYPLGTSPMVINIHNSLRNGYFTESNVRYWSKYNNKLKWYPEENTTPDDTGNSGGDNKQERKIALSIYNQQACPSDVTCTVSIAGVTTLCAINQYSYVNQTVFAADFDGYEISIRIKLESSSYRRAVISVNAGTNITASQTNCVLEVTPYTNSNETTIKFSRSDIYTDSGAAIFIGIS